MDIEQSPTYIALPEHAKEFRCKLHGTKALNTRGLKPRKLEDKEGKIVTNRQRNTIAKAGKDCGFNYLLSHKAVSKGSEEKKYIRTLKWEAHSHNLEIDLKHTLMGGERRTWVWQPRR
jgi:hypothetical protein